MAQASIIDHDTFIDACTFTWGDYQTVPARWQYENDTVNTWIRGDIRLNGANVGYFERRAQDTPAGPSVMHKNIELTSERGHEFTEAFHCHCVARYRELDVISITLRANDVGAYLWAKLGFLFGGDDRAQHANAAQWWKDYGQPRSAALLAGATASRVDLDDLAAHFVEIRRDLARTVVHPPDMLARGNATPGRKTDTQCGWGRSCSSTPSGAGDSRSIDGLGSTKPPPVLQP